MARAKNHEENSTLNKLQGKEGGFNLFVKIILKYKNGEKLSFW